MTTDTTTDTFTIPATRMPYFRERMGKLAARCAKLAMTVVVGFKVLRTYEEQTGTYTAIVNGEPVTHVTTRTLHEVRVSGMAPRLQGWALRGRFDFVSIPGATMRAMVPGYDCPAEFRDVDPERCDACGQARRRNDTFLLQHEDGRHVVVGRSCLADYLGHVSPEHVASMSEVLLELASAGDDEGGFWGGYAPDHFDPQDVTTIAAYSVRTLGWAPSKAEPSTANHVRELLIPCRNAEAEAARRRELREITDEDRARAANALAWAREVDATRSDYLTNLQAIAGAPAIGWKALGLAVSLITAYDRAMEREITRRQREARAADSVHVGTVGKREVFADLTVSMVRSWETAYGTTTLVKFADPDGNTVVWKASGARDFIAGDVYTLKGTVKAHDDYKGEAQTVLTRCANLERTTNAPARTED